MTRRSCAIYATGIVCAHLLILGIALLVAQVFQTMIQERIKKVSLLNFTKSSSYVIKPAFKVTQLSYTRLEHHAELLVSLDVTRNHTADKPKYCHFSLLNHMMVLEIAIPKFLFLLEMRPSFMLCTLNLCFSRLTAPSLTCRWSQHGIKLP